MTVWDDDAMAGREGGASGGAAGPWYDGERWDVVAVGSVFARARPSLSIAFDHFVPRRVEPHDLRALEDEAGVELPVDLRHFLLQVGDEAPGPLRPLLPFVRTGSDPLRSREVARAAEAFQVVAASHDGFSHEVRPGAFRLTEHPNGGWSYLVVAGDRPGEVWVDDDTARARHEQLIRHSGLDTYREPSARELSARRSFADWYGAYLDQLVTSDGVTPLDPSDPSLDRDLGELWVAVVHDPDTAVDRALALLGRRSPARVAPALRSLAFSDPALAVGAAKGFVADEDLNVRRAAFDVFAARAGEDEVPFLEDWVRGLASPISDEQREHLIRVQLVLSRVGRERFADLDQRISHLFAGSITDDRTQLDVLRNVLQDYLGDQFPTIDPDPIPDDHPLRRFGFPPDDDAEPPII